uniref:Uncharacterized protein n=1 Tax=Opuntia streptacantha TaxID=393608 RepID=A0A7C9CVR6_OPUST
MASWTRPTPKESWFSINSPAGHKEFVSTIPFPKYPFGKGGLNLGLPSTAKRSLVFWSAFMFKALLLALHTNAERASKEVHLFRAPSSMAFILSFSRRFGSKQKDRYSIFSE